MKTETYYKDFDIKEVSEKIADIMSKWSVHLIEIKGQEWKIYNHENEIAYQFNFFIDFSDIEGRIKLEDLRLNVIHHIESLKDDTSYIDQLVDPALIY